MNRFMWGWGLLGEYSCDVIVHKDHLEWHVSLDEQWSDPPQKQNQSFSDFFTQGAPDFVHYSQHDIEPVIESVLLEMKMDPKKIPSKTWQYEQTPLGYKGVQTAYEGDRLLWFQHAYDSRGSCGVTEQSYHDFLKKGASVDCPGEILEDLKEWVLKHSE